MCFTHPSLFELCMVRKGTLYRNLGEQRGILIRDENGQEKGLTVFKLIFLHKNGNKNRSRSKNDIGKNRISETEQTDQQLMDNGRETVTPSESTD